MTGISATNSVIASADHIATQNVAGCGGDGEAGQGAGPPGRAVEDRNRVESRHGRDPPSRRPGKHQGVSLYMGVGSARCRPRSSDARLNSPAWTRSSRIWGRRLARAGGERRAGHRQDPAAGGADRSCPRARRARARRPRRRVRDRPAVRAVGGCARRARGRPSRARPRPPGAGRAVERPAGARARARTASNAIASTPRCGRCWRRSPPTPRWSSCSTICTGPTSPRST